MVRIRELANVLEAKVICGDDRLDEEVRIGCTSDLMSDILTLDLENLVLITGLTNLQTIRTAEFADVSCIVLVRNKKASQEMIELANESDLVVMECKYSAFKSTHLVCQAGLLAIEDA